MALNAINKMHPRIIAAAPLAAVARCRSIAM
jgi:hypothetical protein